MKNEKFTPPPPCNNPNDAIEDAIDSTKRDPKSTWDDLVRKMPPVVKPHNDKSEKGTTDDKVAARTQSYKPLRLL